MDKPSRVSFGLCMLNAVYDKTAWLKEREIDASCRPPDRPRPCTRTMVPIFLATLLHVRAGKRASSLFFDPQVLLIMAGILNA